MPDSEKHKDNWIKCIWKWLSMPAGPSQGDYLHDAVNQLAHKYFAEFGIQCIEDEEVACGWGSVVRLEHCDIHIYYHKLDLGIYISRPIDPFQPIAEASPTMVERSMKTFKRKVGPEVERQMKQIIKMFRPILEN